MLNDTFTPQDTDNNVTCGALGRQSDSPLLSGSQHSLEDGIVPLETNNWTMKDLMEKSYNDYYDDTTLLVSGRTSIAKGKYPKSKVEHIQHAGLVLKSPVAYKKDTDPSILPIKPDGMAVCKRCGAMGVKHAFYTKEREFCSVACVQEYTTLCKKGDPVPVPLPVLNFLPKKVKNAEPKRWGTNYKLRRETSAKISEPAVQECERKLRRKSNMTPSDSYDWKPDLWDPEFVAAPVTCFRHAPGADCWEDITRRKVEVENTDCDDSSIFPNTFWVATVLRVCGYYCLLRYDGFDQNSSKDFWLNYGLPDVHSVGWCAIRGNPLIPPKTIEHKQTEWKTYLHKQLTGAETISLNFYTKIAKSGECRFKPGMNVELVDKTRISRVKLATIRRVMGKRLILLYYDSNDPQHGFYCHEDSPLLHHVGWAREVGAQIDAPRDYLLRCATEDYDENDATKELFCDRIVPIPDLPPDCAFKVGMKLEAIDPLNLSTICVATVMEVLRDGYVMIRINSYGDDPSNSDWFCYHSSSTCIFPAGFCDVNDIPLTPPKGYRSGTFKWTEYLKETGYETAPIALFNRVVPDHGFKVGMRLEAADLMDPRLVCGASVSRVVTRLLKVHFDGWDEEYDQWLDCESPDIYPVGWCELVGHKLERPGPPRFTSQAPAKQAPKSQKKLRRRSRKGKGSPETSVGRKVVSASLTSGMKDRPERILRKLPPEQTVSEDKGDTTKFPARQQRARRTVRNVARLQSTKSKRQTSDILTDSCVPENNKNNNSSANENDDDDDDVPETEYEPEIALDTDSESQVEEESVKEDKDDQTIPVMSEPKKPPGKPNEPTGTLHITHMGAGDKLIPCLDTNGSGFERGELLPEQWNACDVAEFLIVNDCKTYSNNFIKENVDGKTFLGLTKDEVMNLADMKVGPSLKIYALIEQLKVKANPGRLKAFNTKVSPKLQPDK